ncbi:MAG TPA: hypothetical protein PLB62_06520, partial [Candidatus Sumerlaeota bacterium]|nr:hypothetical protein [Candidatus Sumerlaeota bacterium]
MLRLIINKAKHHYNLAVEHAERNRPYEAITELQNSLDLDRSNINAYVLLGTIYAKQMKFQEAIEEWSAALAVNPGTQKAFNYIQKAAQVQKALPVIKWVKISIGGLAASFILILILAYNLVRPNPDEVLLNKALDEFRIKRYGSALEKVESLPDRYPSSRLLPMAQQISASIRLEINQKREQINREMNSGAFGKALAACDELVKMYPDTATLEYLVYIKDYARFSLIQSIEEHLREMGQSGSSASHQDIQALIKTLEQYFPADPAVRDIALKYESVRDYDALRERNAFNEELAAISRIESIPDSINALVNLRKKNPELAGEAGVEQRIQNLTRLMLDEKAAAIQAYLEKGEMESAGSLIRDVTPEQMKPFPLLARDFERLERLHQQLLADKAQEKNEAFLRQLEEALISGQHDTIADLISKGEQMNLDSKGLSRYERIKSDFQTREALFLYKKIINLSSIDSPDDLTEQDA